MEKIAAFTTASAVIALSTGAVSAHESSAAGSTAARQTQIATAQSNLESLPTVDALPDGVVQVSPVIPGMGAHWANPKNLPLGPIYCVIEGRVTCMEYMISQDDFEAGKSFTELRPWFEGAEQPAIDHIEFNFEPNGHEGYEIPHYDVHLYFVSPEVRKTQTQAQR